MNHDEIHVQLSVCNEGVNLECKKPLSRDRGFRIPF